MLEDEHSLSLGMLMHVKCIHELCTLLSWLPTYLHHIYWYIHVLYWFMGILQWFPFIWDLTLQGRKPCFWCFRTQTDSKRTHIRGILFFIEEKQPGPKKHARRGPRLQRAWSPRPRGARRPPSRCHDRRIALILRPSSPYDLKTTIYGLPSAATRREATKNHQRRK